MKKCKFVIENIKGLEQELLLRKTMEFKEKLIREAIAKKVGKSNIDLLNYKDVTRVEIQDKIENVFFKDKSLITFYPVELVMRDENFDISNFYEIH